MKVYYLLISILLECSINSINAQNFTFASDANGNRTGRTITLLKSTVATSQDSSQVQKNPDITNDQIGDVLITLYPNPTKGVVIVQLQNLGENLSTQLKVYDYSGRLIISLTNLQYTNIIDLNSFENATYIAKISIGEAISEWKIIKE